MGKHGNRDSNTQHEGRDKGYEPRHSGGQDGYEWSQNQDDTPTEKLPKVKLSKERW